MKDTFLLDEVRCGFLIPAAIKQAWAAGLEVLMEIDRVCKKHNIQYFADWGTLLGTVRHGGFIPWDDDLDIVMKREDYIKFMTVARFDMEEGFDVQTFRNHDDCWLFMGKVVGRNGFCFEKEHLRRFHNFPYISCVDIFVLDYVYRDPKKEQERRELCLYILAVADSVVDKRMSPEDREYRLKLLEEKWGRKLPRMEEQVEIRRYLYGELEKIFAEVPESEADKLTQLFPWGLKGDARHYFKECYEEAVYLPFEYTLMPVPKMYDKMLRQRYREFFRLVKNAGAHDYPFFEGQKKNLQKVLDFELPVFKFDSGKLFRSEAEEACKGLSYKVMAKECADELWRMKDELFATVGSIVAEPTCVERALDLLAESQQLAIDLGNMIEQFLGEGCSVISLLGQYCEVLYRVYEQISAGANDEIADTEDIDIASGSLDNLQEAILADMKQNIFGRKTVLFLPVLAKDWDSLNGLWQKYVNDAQCDVYVVPLQYYYKDYDGSPRKVNCDVTEFLESVQVLDYYVLTPEYMEMLHPEIIVIQNPYDSWNPAISVPEMFYSENIRKYTDELIYVPPFVLEEYSKNNEREYSNMRYYVTMPGVVYADRVLVQSENMRQMYIEKLTEFAGEETSKVWEQRIQSCELSAMEQEENASCATGSEEKNKNKPQKKKMLYGISLGAYMEDVDVAKEKLVRNLQLFEECKAKIDLTIQIFPDGTDSNGLRSAVKGLLGQYAGKIAGDGEKCHAKEFDAYYGDVMPLMMEFMECEKPIMVQDYGIHSN